MPQTTGRPSLLEDESEGPASAAETKATRRQVVMLVLGVAALAIAAFMAVRGPGRGVDSAAAASRKRPSICSESFEVFQEFRIKQGDSQPWANPKTGRRTIYPAEACYWTKDGGVTLEPTWVLLNEYVGKPERTKCPECGRDVVAHNPMPPIEKMSALAEESLRGSRR